jgi:hypothetical protein
MTPEPEGSSTYSQEPAISPYPEPTGSNLHSPSQSPYLIFRRRENGILQGITAFPQFNTLLISSRIQF